MRLKNYAKDYLIRRDRTPDLLRTQTSTAGREAGGSQERLGKEESILRRVILMLYTPLLEEEKG